MNNIIGFHGFLNKKFSFNFSDISEHKFENSITKFMDCGYKFSNIFDFNELDKKSISIYFDDGKKNIYEPIIKIKENNVDFTATVFVIGKTLSNIQKKVDIFKEKYMSLEEIKNLIKIGVEIGSHSYSHHPLKFLNDVDLKREISYSKIILEDKLGKEVNSFSIPYGSYDQRVVDAIYCEGYKKIVSIKNNFTLKSVLSAWPITRLDDSDTIFSRIENNNYIYKINYLNKFLYNQFSKGSVILKRLFY